MTALFDREEITIVSTDSGLGGLSISAEVAERLRENGAFRKARVIFFSCTPSASAGFDSMDSNARRYRVFSNALDAMVGNFSPDAILIACNTLAVLYDHTAFSKRARVPVLGIVEMGTDAIGQYLQEAPDGQVIMFAARTTVQTGVHKKMLVEKGFKAENLVYQECAGLIAAIERGPRSDETRSLIRRHVKEGTAKLPDRSRPVAGALLCTHFGYSMDLFREAFRETPFVQAPLLDPDLQMADTFLAGAHAGRFARPQVDIEVISHIPVSPEQREAIGAVVAVRSEQAAAALRDYRFVPGLFAIE